MKFIVLLWRSLGTRSVSLYWLLKGCYLLKWPTWIRPCLDETCGIMVERAATTSKCREKTKDLILVKELKEKPPPYVLLYPPLPLTASSSPLPLTSHGESRGTVTPVKSALKASGSSNPLTSLSHMEHIPTLSPPVLLPNSHSIWSIYPVSTRTLPLLRLLLPCRCPWGRTVVQYSMMRMVKYKEEGRCLSTTPDLIKWKYHTPSFMENFT
jgi:hypothetical protein